MQSEIRDSYERIFYIGGRNDEVRINYHTFVCALRKANHY